jgi:hypothetical protein
MPKILGCQEHAKHRASAPARQDAENTAVGERGERSIPVYGKNHPVRSSGAARAVAQPLREKFSSSHSFAREGRLMPRGKHMAGVSAKEQRQYEHIKESAEKSGRYGSRAKEVAARTVMKEHKRKGHAKGK